MTHDKPPRPNQPNQPIQPSRTQLLLEYRADFRYGGPGKISALAGAAAWASSETVKAILEAKCPGENLRFHISYRRAKYRHVSKNDETRTSKNGMEVWVGEMIM